MGREKTKEWELQSKRSNTIVSGVPGRKKRRNRTFPHM
jgi:hypothetical protein